ncbi:MAG: P1 family peptidase [Stappiaceae bacterium]
MKQGPKNLITDVPGLKVGNAHNAHFKTGTTVLLPDEPITASVAIHGGAPGTRDAALLEPDHTLEKVDALVLSGGSAFGLDASGGVQQWLKEQGRGLTIGSAQIPIVPGAIIFDLLNNGNKDWGPMPPYRDLAISACTNADHDFTLGTCGAGYGATTARLKGGLGSASTVLENGVTIGALVAVNSIGSPTMGDGRQFWAAPFEINDEFGGLGLPEKVTHSTTKIRVKSIPLEPGANTTIAIIATDADLTKSACKRLAIESHDGISRAIWPAHSPLDGDLVFAASTARVALKDPVADFLEVGAAAAATLSRAIARAVYEATTEENDILPTWTDFHPAG